MMKEQLQFVYGEPALTIKAGRKTCVVIGDLHIGAERRLFKRGVHVYGSNVIMAERLKKIAKASDASAIVVLGDVKESVLYPDNSERREIVGFFELLSDYDVTVVRGNHDSHLEEVVAVKPVDELLLGDFAMVHGHMWPSEDAMSRRWVLAGHNHMAVRITDKNKGIYFEKAWLVAKPNLKLALVRYPKMEKRAELVVFPAFNDLITGIAANEKIDNNFSPMFRNGVFDYKNGTLFSLMGDVLGTPKHLARKAIPKVFLS
jgi:hypothetical protein